MTPNTDTGQWLPIESAPYSVPVWGFRLDPGSPWAYGVLSLVERHQEEGADGWCLREDGEEIDPPVLWAPAQIPLRPNPPGADVSALAHGKPGEVAPSEHPSPSPDLTDEAMARAFCWTSRLEPETPTHHRRVCRNSRCADAGTCLASRPYGNSGLQLEAIRAAYLASPGPSLQAEVERLRAAISWALGEGDSDFGDKAPPTGSKRRFWWRDELRARALNPTLTNEEKS